MRVETIAFVARPLSQKPVASFSSRHHNAYKKTSPRSDPKLILTRLVRDAGATTAARLATVDVGIDRRGVTILLLGGGAVLRLVRGVPNDARLSLVTATCALRCDVDARIE